MNLNLVPTLISESEDSLSNSHSPAVTKLRKPPILRLLQKDEQDKFEDHDRFAFSVKSTNPYCQI